jgi:2-succinyl-6-hydroxy-2,4-cyclohexadiene-1-carboxylate synthase
MLAHLESGQGTPVTFLHGFTQRAESWSELWAALDGVGRLIAVDLPGHGRSPDQPSTLPGAAAALAEVWAALGVERTHLVGYSLGGRLALWAAVELPEQILTLTTIGAHAGFEGEVRAQRQADDEALAQRIERDGIDWFARYWAGLPLFQGLARRGTEQLARLDAMRRQNRPSGLAASLRGMGGAAMEPFWDRLPQICAPTLLVAGAEDEPYVEQAAHLRASLRPHLGTVALVPGAGHAAHLEQPERVAALLRRHLAIG